MSPYTITIDSEFQELWRYNIVVMAETCAGGRRVELLKHHSEVAAVGAELAAPPAKYDACRRVSLRSLPAESLTLYIYIIPHTLPTASLVCEAKPFPLRVDICHGDRAIYGHTHEINQWAGENIELHL